MDKDTALAKVKDVVAKQLSIEEEKVTLESSFTDDLGADSLDLVELVMAFEEEFDVEIPDEDVEQLQTIGNAVDYLVSRANG